MQRQSLGSPSSKLVKDEQQFVPESVKQVFAPSSSSSTAAALGGNSLFGQKECRPEEEAETLKKLMRPKPKSVPLETYIHLIPILILFCFFVLYLSSHDPSQIDLAEFNILKPATNLREESISELERIVEIKKGDILSIRSLKNLEQTTAGLRRRRHRKIAGI